MNLKALLKGIYLSIKYGQKVDKQDSCILVNLPQNKFNRYLFPLVYNLNQSGYKPILNLSYSGIAHLSHDEYQSLIFTQKLLFIGSKKEYVKEITLNPDYFTAIKNNSKKTNILPMCMHPLVYKNNVTATKNKNSNKVIFFAGTTTGQGHDKIQVFDGIINRYTIIDVIKKLNNSVFIDNQIPKINFADTNELKILIFERHKIDLPQDEMFDYMSQCSFFLALPGRGMPLCHNLIEAMYCNSIPILQDKYAEMMPIPLEDKVNCLTYSDMKSFKKLIKSIDVISIDIVNSIRQNVSKYYQNYLSYQAVTKQIMDSQENMFYMQAEGFSIKLYQNNNIN